MLWEGSRVIKHCLVGAHGNMDGDVGHGLQCRKNMGVWRSEQQWVRIEVKDLERYISANDCFVTPSFNSYILVLAVSIASSLCLLLDSGAPTFPRTTCMQSLVMRR